MPVRDEDDEDDRGVPSAPRGYTHRACGESTSLSGMHLLQLCDPFSATVGTYCGDCDDHFPLKEFTWDDTGERISTARKRHRAMGPAWFRVLHGRAGCAGFLLLCAVAAAGPGYAVGRLLKAPGWVFPLVAAPVGLVAGLMTLGFASHGVMRRYYDIDDWRELR
jgi:hypothetical protein